MIATDESTAGRAAELVRAEWRDHDLVESRGVPAYFKKNSTPPVPNFNVRYPPLIEKGSVAVALAKAEKRH